MKTGSRKRKELSLTCVCMLINLEVTQRCWRDPSLGHCGGSKTAADTATVATVTRPMGHVAFIPRDPVSSSLLAVVMYRLK